MEAQGMYQDKNQSGFSLAELLVALTILGVISTFTIPKILTSQQNSTYNAISKEAFGSISTAFQMYVQANGAPSSTTTPNNIVSPYLNYVSSDTSSQIDDIPGFATPINCSVSVCYHLHNGAILRPQTCSFGGTSNLNVVTFWLDPDGVFTGKQDSLKIFLHYNGKIENLANVVNGSTNSCTGALSPIPGSDPAWFSW